MPTNPRSSGRESAEGSRDAAERELQRSQPKQPATRRGRPRAGDEAPTGTPGTGEDVCPTCKGIGRVGSRPCADCEGTGRVIKAIGGA
jgi:DnaJ-class molecular chaperone